jgi:hypothetical protein
MQRKGRRWERQKAEDKRTMGRNEGIKEFEDLKMGVVFTLFLSFTILLQILVQVGSPVQNFMAHLRKLD